MRHSTQALHDPWTDEDCIEAFVDRNYDSFQDFMVDKNVHHDYWCDHYLEYCESRSSRFLDFAYNYSSD